MEVISLDDEATVVEHDELGDQSAGGEVLTIGTTCSPLKSGEPKSSKVVERDCQLPRPRWIRR